MLGWLKNGKKKSYEKAGSKPKHSLQMERARGGDVQVKKTVCTIVTVGYSVRMKRRLGVQCKVWTFPFFSEVDKDVVDPS